MVPAGLIFGSLLRAGITSFGGSGMCRSRGGSIGQSLGQFKPPCQGIGSCLNIKLPPLPVRRERAGVRVSTNSAAHSIPRHWNIVSPADFLELIGGHFEELRPRLAMRMPCHL